MTLIVAVSDGETTVAEWGPFPSRVKAEQFAKFVTAEIDPARVMEVYAAEPPAGLLSPLAELLTWYERFGGGK